MIITHTVNGRGDRRIYIGGRSSLECWIEPSDDGWRLCLEPAYCGNQVSDDDRWQWQQWIKAYLSDRLSTVPEDLSRVPFDSIAALHTPDPYEFQRAAATKSRKGDDKFMALTPRTPVSRQN